MRNSGGVLTLAVVLAIGSTTGCDSVSGTPPEHAGSYAPSASPSPSADPQRLAVCDEAQNRAADGIAVINEYGDAAPADVDFARVQKTFNEMMAVQKKMPPALGSRYSGLTSAVAQIVLATIARQPAGVTTTGLRETTLLFVAECQQWAETPE
ncbi:hypothetical protein [Actinoplanes sp. NBRC 103695]|uniref:hypothetical protein n=1 Tax=Actinoplanes sp. NBRC 103695 TaxID=3032202 RepID=UPI0025572AE1|nr:hypothetical protein [Actinoplanes sp. NBRC 103695]